jgi:hypothetical protein
MVTLVEDGGRNKTMKANGRLGNLMKRKVTICSVGCLIAAFSVLTCLNGIVHAGEVITEIRFRENGITAESAGMEGEGQSV